MRCLTRLEGRPKSGSLCSPPLATTHQHSPLTTHHSPPPLTTATGISLRTQELYLLVFLTRYLDLFYSYISLYNSVMKVIYVSSSATSVQRVPRRLAAA